MSGTYEQIKISGQYEGTVRVTVSIYLWSNYRFFQTNSICVTQQWEILL